MRTTVIIMGLFFFVAGAWGDSLFQKSVAERGTLVANKKAKFEVGDLINVLVRENIDAFTRSDTRTKKQSTLGSEALPEDNEFLVAPKPSGLGILTAGQLPNYSIDLNSESKSRGSTIRKNTLLMTVSCAVTHVHKNGNLDIEGEKHVIVNREESRMVVKGTIRSRDVSPTNSIDSNLLANANVELRGRGPLWNSQRRGLIMRFVDWISPY